MPVMSNPPVGRPVIIGADGRPCDTRTIADPPAPPPPLVLRLGLDGHHAILNGVDVSSAVRGVTINARADWPATVQLYLDGIAEIQLGEGSEVSLPPTTVETLVALGWTPPQGQR